MADDQLTLSDYRPTEPVADSFYEEQVGAPAASAPVAYAHGYNEFERGLKDAPSGDWLIFDTEAMLKYVPVTAYELEVTLVVAVPVFGATDDSNFGDELNDLLGVMNNQINLLSETDSAPLCATDQVAVTLIIVEPATTAASPYVLWTTPQPHEATYKPYVPPYQVQAAYTTKPSLDHQANDDAFDMAFERSVDELLTPVDVATLLQPAVDIQLAASCYEQSHNWLLTTPLASSVSATDAQSIQQPDVYVLVVKTYMSQTKTIISFDDAPDFSIVDVLEKVVALANDLDIP